MGNFIILSRSEDNSVSYISNTSPLLWTDNKSEAKIFRSEGEIMTDLSDHKESLDKMEKELNIKFEMEQIL